LKASTALPFLALALWAMEAQAGAIHGHLSAPPRAAQTASGTAVMGGGPEEAVVWVDSLPANLQKRFRPKPQTREVTVNSAFVPRVTAVDEGSAVRFSNRDDVYHQVFSVSPAKRFDLGKSAPHHVGEVTFDQCGVVDVYDELHPEMAAYVVVVPHRLFARPSRAGDFVLPDLPAGTYLLHVWHPAYGEMRRAVEVPHTGVAMLSLSY
jgi:plastocyanin